MSNPSLRTRVEIQQQIHQLRQQLNLLEKQLGKDDVPQETPRDHDPGSATPFLAPVVSEVPMAATRTVMHQIVPPSETDTLGICFGGQVLSWIDVCAGLSAKTFAKGPCVTASVDAVHFLRPCRLGHVVIVAAMVNRTFNSSMEIGVRVESEDMRTGLRCHCCSAYLTFVSLHSRQKDKSRPLPRVVPSSADHRLIYRAAEARRQERLQQRRHLKEDPELARAEAQCRLQPITHRDNCPTLPPAIMLREHDVSNGPLRVAPSATVAYMTQSIMPQHANTIGITFGGQVMRWMEQCAYISASRLRCLHLLTASMDMVSFAEPTRVGDVLYITAQVSAIFGSSLEVMISVHGEDPARGELFHCADAFATVVMVDDGGNPSSAHAELEPILPAEKMRAEGARARREARLLLREALAKHETRRPSLDGSIPSASSTTVLSPARSSGSILDRITST